MTDFYMTVGADDIWQLPSHSDVHSIEATEIWLQPSEDKVNVKTRIIGPDEESRDAWLNQRTKGVGEDAQSLLGRFVWLVADSNDMTISLSQPVQDILLKKFGLKLAYNYFRSFASGVTALPRVSTPDFDRRAYAFCYGPKIAAIWSHTMFKGERSGLCVTEGLIFLRAPPKQAKPGGDPSKKNRNPLKELQGFLQKIPLSPAVCRSSAFPAYLFSLLLSREISQTQVGIAEKMRYIEGQTGFHDFESRTKPPHQSELGPLSAKAGGFATKLAGVERKRHMVEKLLDFISRHVDEDAKHGHKIGLRAEDPGAETAEEHPLKFNAEVLRERLEMLAMDTAYTMKRVQIQIEAVSLHDLWHRMNVFVGDQLTSLQLFSLISQNDSMNNYELSMWTKDISLSSQRDASSMKTLAVVTMFFLPGSFISALFSTPCFDWDVVDLTLKNIGVPITPQFHLYWAITIPLTVLTFLLYFYWLWFQHRRQKRLETDRLIKATELGYLPAIQSQRSTRDSGFREAEVYKLAARRRNTSITTEDTDSKSSTWFPVSKEPYGQV